MGTSVTFEDLFDFSPEPPTPPVEITDYLEDLTYQPVYPKTLTNALQTPAASLSPIALKTEVEEDHLPTDNYLPDKEDNYLNVDEFSLYNRTSPSPVQTLSASLPSKWTQNNFTGFSSSGSSGDLGSSEAFGNLVDDLKSAVVGAATSVSGRSKRGRKPGQKNANSDMKNKLERSRQSARECRARKKLRYQYLDDMILEREKANIKLREELLQYQAWCHELDSGKIPDGLRDFLRQMSIEQTTKQL